MPNQSEGPIVVFDASVTSINFALAQVLERLDMALGLRGVVNIHDSTEVGAPLLQEDAARLADLPSEQPSAPLYWVTQMRTFSGDEPIHDLQQALWPVMLMAAQMLRPRDPDTGTPLVVVDAGVYTPTLTGVANVAAATAYQCQYMRVGSVVTVSGKVDVDPTAAVATQMGISLPIASAIAAAEDCSGTAFASGIAGQGAAIRGDAANGRAEMVWLAIDVTNQPMYFVFAYRII